MDIEKAQKEIAALEARLSKNKATLEGLVAKQAASADARRDAKASKGAIRQGVKAQVDTVPMPVRLTVAQMKALKLLAAMEGRTASGIIRDCVDLHLEQKLAESPSFAAALAAQH